ncbi:MAG: 2-oxo acid dehydrogenase subunit E2 [Clostridiales bacterium]|nr:2-oxo acid dehydrogenase subunit E2 [Clostridiales bacterium]
MFGHRSDGKKVKGLDIIEKASPFFMPQRIDAVNYITVKIPCTSMDEFIARERKNGNSYSYMHILFATIIRVLYTKKKLNRFIMNGVIYQRNTISITMDVKKKLTEEGEDMTLKFFFTGRETLAQIKEIIDSEIAKNIAPDEVSDQTTKTASKFCKLPAFLFRWAMALARWADKHGMLPKGLIKASPFHTSCFVTNLKSIKLGHIYHHIYNFGTTTMFFSMGKEQMEPVVENNKELKVGKILNIGMSLDERVADGFYMGKCLKLFKDLMTNPDSLLEAMPDDGSIPKKMVKKRSKKVGKVKNIKKEKKEKKPKKIKPLKNKEKHDKKMKKKKNIEMIGE